MISPLVSVVTPCLNPGPALDACLESVSKQSYPHVEHIIVDGGSSDGTVDKLRGCQGIRWVSEPDDGQSDALRKGFDLATGEYLTWLNDDDVLLPDAFAAAVDALRGDPAAGFAYGNVELRRGADSVLLRTPEDVTPQTFWWENRVMQPGTVFTRQAYDRVGGMDTSLHLALDHDLWVRFLDAGIRGVHVDQTLAVYPVHEASKTGTAGTAAFLEEEVRVYRKVSWDRHAAIALGRAAAHHAVIRSVADRRSVGSEISTLSARLDDPRFRPDGGLVRGAAHAEAARVLLTMGRPTAALKPLLRLDVWRYPEPRRVARGTFRRLVGRVLHGRETGATVESIVRGA